MIEVYPIGTKVTLEGGIPGNIIAILLEPRNGIQYKISWWNGRERKSEWLYDCVDFEPSKYTTQQIGFINV
jgi:hypothetical protein